LSKLCQDETEATKALKLGKKQTDAIAANLNVQTAPTMPALQRYVGTLYEAIDVGSLSPSQLRRAKETVLIQSALFGLIPATDLIPNYRLSAGTTLPGLNLKQIWSEAHLPIWNRLDNHQIIDLRSKSYAELAPIPEAVEHRWVEVLSRESGGKLRALNHFNKKAKGELVGAILRSETPVETIDGLAQVAASIGMELVESKKNRDLLLITEQIPISGGAKPKG
jgi:cytoplasmic iron level regulating protein YaaA (DUF328/UPF0246 family)